jgi:hypothetical protein
MKTSNKILLAVLAVVVVVMITAIVGLRFYVDRLISESGGTISERGITGSDELVTRTYDVRGFTGVEISGGWQVEVSEGEEFSLEIETRKKYLDYIAVGVEGDTLRIEAKNIFSFEHSRMEARIVMPELDSFSSTGGLKLDIRGFSGDELSISGKGGSSVEGRGGGYERMDLRFSGGTELDLEELPATNVELHSQGAIDAVLSMRGGTLSGKLSGAGSVGYHGSVSQQNLTTEGVAEVKQLGSQND